MKRKETAKALVGLAALWILISLTGCMYPEDATPGANASAREAVLTVQDAVDRYQEKTGLLPIANADEKVPLYEKYKVDFGKLKRMGFIGQVPSAAFESGGSYQFLIIDEETAPTVKMLDLTVFQAAADIQRKTDEYRRANGNRNPSGEEAFPGFAAVDFSKLGMKAPDARSMYSRHPLTWIVDGEGRVYADYAIDVSTAVEKSGKQPSAGDDLRRTLVDASYYVPVRAPAYRWVDGAPVAARP